MNPYIKVYKMYNLTYLDRLQNMLIHQEGLKAMK